MSVVMVKAETEQYLYCEECNSITIHRGPINGMMVCENGAHYRPAKERVFLPKRLGKKPKAMVIPTLEDKVRLRRDPFFKRNSNRWR